MHSKGQSRLVRQRPSILNVLPNFSKLACLILVILLHARLASSAATTVFDGVTRDKYVTYLKLDGTNGAVAPIPDGTSLKNDQQYTFMLWFKPMSSDWGTRLQYAFRLPDSFSCYFSAPQSMICESAQQCDKLIVSTSKIYVNQWVHLTVSGNPRTGSYAQLESHTEILASDTKSYVIFQQPFWGWTACVGSCQSLYGFVGGLREFKYINTYMTPQTAQRMKNHYLTWDASIRAYFRFNGDTYFNKDEFRATYAILDSTAEKAIDYIANDICYPPEWDFEQFMSFTEDNLVKDINFGSNWVPLATSYNYVMSMWINLSPDSCFTANPATARSSCFIFKLDEVMMLYLDKRGSARFYFYALQNYLETQSTPMLIPERQWVNIQIYFSQYELEIRQFDMLGRQVYFENVKQNYQEQRSNKKLFLFNNFRGHVRSFTLVADKIALPLSPSAAVNNKNTLAHFTFQPAYISGKTAYTSAFYGLSTLTFNNTPVFEFRPWQAYAFYSGATAGLTSSPDSLFDGVACNDGYKTLQFTSKSAYVQANSTVSSWLNSATIEFWFRQTAPLNQTDYLFSMWGIQTKHEFFSIYLNDNKQLICGPFGIDNARSVFLTYNDFTETNRQIYKWLHITCQYEYQTQITGHLFHAPLEKQYTTSLTTTPSYIPADNYYIILGNSYNQNRGTPSLLMKEVRVWPFKRSYLDIQEFRYRQINPNSLSSSNRLLAYLRLTEAGYHEYDFANAANPLVPAHTKDQDINYTPDSGVTVCPQQTYYMNSLCYLNPVKLAVPAVFPFYDTAAAQLYYIITGNATSLINTTYASVLMMNLQADDSIVSSFIQNSTNKFELKVPARAIRDGNPYQITVNVTNQGRTFEEVATVNFMPVSCKFYIVEGSNSYQAYNNYLYSQASRDITFRLVFNQLSSTCDQDRFFNTLVANLTYKISPPPAQYPNLVYTFNADKSITVTIPKEEQSKLQTKTDLKFLFQVYYTNSEYRHLINPKKFHFQDVMYTLNFNYEQQSVIPVLTANTNEIMNNDTLVLNASQSYITGMFDTNLGTLEFQWICDPVFTAHCSSVSGPILRVTYDDFTKAKAQYNQTYNFQVQVVWTLVDGTIKLFYASQNVVFYNVQSPSFTISYLTPVRSTADQQKFRLVFDSVQSADIPNLAITWSIVPNLTLPTYYNFTEGDTLLTVPKGGFNTMTSYTLSVSVKNKMYPIATKSNQISFMTQQPPFGGSASITPNSGFLSTTTFSITISNWQSINRPIQFRVWSTTSVLGTELKELISTGWVAETASFDFQAQSSNPFQVEISDASQESAFIKLTPTISAQATNLNLMLTKAVATEDDYSLKYTYLKAIVNTLNTVNETQNDDAAASQQQTSYISTMVDSISKDISNINTSKSIENGDASAVIQDSVSMLSKMLADSRVLNDHIVENSVQILDSVQSTKQVFNDLIEESTEFSQNYATTLSKVLLYSDKKASTVFNNRLLADSTSVAGILDLNKRVKATKDRLLGYICNNTQSSSATSLYLQTAAFDIQVQKISMMSKIESVTSVFQEDSKTQLKINVTDLIDQVLTKSLLSPPSSFCILTTHYKLNLIPLTKSEKVTLTQYASSLMDFAITDETGLRELTDINLKQSAELQFSINPNTFKNNQSLCQVYSTDQGWSSNPCMSEVDKDNKILKCQCNMIDNQLYTVFTDSSRSKGEVIFPPEEEIKPPIDRIIAQYMTNASLSYLGIILMVVVLGVGMVLASVILDKNDRICYSRIPENPHKLELLKTLSSLSNHPLGLWIYKQDQVISYSIPNKSNFSHMLANLHPVFSVFSKFDVTQSRLSRFSLYFLQVSVYAAACVVYFSRNYRTEDLSRNDTVIDEQDMSSIVSIGVIGMFFLLPIPYSNRLFRAKVKEVCNSSRNMNPIGNNSVSILPQYQHEITQEDILTPHRGTRRTEDKELFRNALNDLQISEKCTCLKITVLLLAYSIAGATIAYAVLINKNISIAGQYCTVTTFYSGFFGNIFITSILKILFNTLCAPNILNNEKSCLRLLVSSDAVQILKDRRSVQQAEKLVSPKASERHNETDNSVQKTENDQDNLRILSEIDIPTNRIIMDNFNVDVTFDEPDDDMVSQSKNASRKVKVSQYLSATTPTKKSSSKLKEDESDSQLQYNIGPLEKTYKAQDKTLDAMYVSVTDEQCTPKKDDNE